MDTSARDGSSSIAEKIRLTRAQRVGLGFIVLAGAMLRLTYQYHRSFMGDEVGTLIWMRSPAKYIVSHFAIWLTMNYFIVIERWTWLLLGCNSWVLTALPLAAGILIIPLTCQLALRFTTARTALIAAALVAVNPYLIQFAPQIRSYSLMGMLSLLTVILYLRWRERRNFLNGMECAGAMFLCCLSSPNGLYIVIFIGLLYLADVCILPEFRPPWNRAGLSLCIPVAVACVVICAAYAPMRHDMKAAQADWTNIPPTGVGYFPAALGSYFGMGYFALLPTALLLAGSWSASQNRIRILLLWLPMAVGMLYMSLEGLDHFPWGYTRFLSYGLPFLSIIMAEGIEWAAQWAPAAGGWTTAAVTGLALANSVPDLHSLYREKAGQAWNEVGQYLDSHKSNAVIAGEFDSLNLWPFYQKGEFTLLKPADLIGNSVLPANGPVTIFYVSASPLRLKTHAPTLRVGQLRIITYQGASTNAALGQLYQDLQATVADKIRSDQFQYAEALVALNAYFKDSRHVAQFDRELILSAVGEPPGFTRPDKQRSAFYHVFVSRYISLNSSASN